MALLRHTHLQLMYVTDAAWAEEENLLPYGLANAKSLALKVLFAV